MYTKVYHIVHVQGTGTLHQISTYGLIFCMGGNILKVLPR